MKLALGFAGAIATLAILGIPELLALWRARRVEIKRTRGWGPPK